LRRVWASLRVRYEQIEFEDREGEVVLRFSDDEGPAGAGGASRDLYAVRLEQDIRLVRDERIGRVVATARVGPLIPRETLEKRVGESGYSVVLDRSAQRVIHHPSRSLRGGPLDMLRQRWAIDEASLHRSAGRFAYSEEQSDRVAAFVSLVEPEWTIVATASLEEFAGPFRNLGYLYLAGVVFVIGIVSIAFTALTNRATRTLRELTAAADEVGAGNYEPLLPSGGDGEIGRLNDAFGLMARKIRQTLRDVESSRRMAAVGEFAARISHEIRNPLTSIKLNLQGLERQGESRRAGIALREIERLDQVVDAILTLGRPRPLKRSSCSVHGCVSQAVDLLEPQLHRRNVRVVQRLDADRFTVLGDEGQLRSVFLNLLLNAIEAMPEGGTVEITSGSDDRHVRITVSDDGPGVAAANRDAIFDPFVSTKREGSGFGLPMSLRAVEEHGGHLGLADRDDKRRGACFSVTLPLEEPDPGLAGSGPPHPETRTSRAAPRTEPVGHLESR
jgi:signal transduction histidine kinase